MTDKNSSVQLKTDEAISRKVISSVSLLHLRKFTMNRSASTAIVIKLLKKSSVSALKETY